MEEALRRRVPPPSGLAPSVGLQQQPQPQQQPQQQQPQRGETLFALPPPLPQRAAVGSVLLSKSQAQGSGQQGPPSAAAVFASPVRSSTSSSSLNNTSTQSPFRPPIPVQSFEDLTQSSSTSSFSTTTATLAATTDPGPPSPATNFAFENGQLLFWALLPPFAILLAFGGKPTLLTLAFGSLVAYIFDLIGSIEGTLMVALIAVLGIWTSLVWAARVILKQSLYNFTILVVMGVLLLYLFLAVASFFRSIRTEFESTFELLETLMVATLPLLSSVLVTWFVCVELPDLDVPTVFSTTYFAYILFLCKPRNVPLSSRLVLSPKMAIAVYSVPIYFAPFVHAASHHHAIYRSLRVGYFHQLCDLAYSALYPLLLMTIAAEQHSGYYSSSSSSTTATSKTISSTLGVTKIMSFCALLFCMQSHPYFTELKSASNLGEPFSILVYVGIAILTGVGVTLSTRAKSQSISTLSPYGSPMEKGGKGGQTSKMQKYLVTGVVGAVCALLGVACRLPKFILVVATVGGMAFSEYCQNWSGHGRGWVSWLIGQALVFFAGSCASVAALSAVGPSLYFLDVDFAWHGVEFSIKQLCMGFTCVASLVLTITSLALQARPGTPSQNQALLLPTMASQENLESISASSSSTSSSSEPNAKLGDSGSAVAGRNALPFSVAYTILLLIVSAFELFVREQNWETWETQVEDVYPTFLFGSTALALSMLSYRMYSKQLLLNDACTWVCLTAQVFKLLHLAGLQSDTIFASFSIFLAYSLPFIIHRHLFLLPAGKKAGKELGFVHLWGYFVVCVTFTAFARHRLLHVLLEVALLRDVTNAQSSAAAIALMSAFSAAMLYAFRPTASLLRSVLLVIAALCILVVSDTLPLTLDPSSPTILVLAEHPDLYDNSGLYFVLSASLLLLAAGGVIAVRRPVSRVLFTGMLAFCSGKALAGWAFPMSLSTDSPHYGYLQLPALYSFGSVFLAITASLNVSLPSGKLTDGSTDSLPYVLLTLVPVAALLYAFLAGDSEHYSGIVWGAFLVNAVTAFITRCAEMSRGVETATATSNGDPSVAATAIMEKSARNSAATTVCTMASVVAICWSVVGSASISSPHVDSDVSIPLSFLLLLCTKRNMLVHNAHPLALAVIASACFWILSVLHSVFFKNFGLDNKPREFEPSFGLFKDEDISIWSSNTPYHWLPILNLLLALIPLPAIIVSYLRRKTDTEDMVFVLAILACVSIVGAQCWSVRYLGMSGLVFAAYRCWEIGAVHSVGNRLI